MEITDILSLVGGLALFLLGMNSMGNGLENACGNKMKSILEKLTSNRFVGVIVGMLITAIIQSSSATTVMVVGFVNAGMMTLAQAVWVIMGANIGTTITGQLIALDIGWIAPIFAIVGVVMMVFLKKQTLNEIGKIFCGFGILFIGMGMMSDAMSPLKDSEAFVNLMTKFSNPILGILAGAVFTAIIQSSSASIGILQALALSGTIGLESAVFVLFGQNIGTCVTALLASLGTSRCAKRTTLIHLIFNLTGTIIFTLIFILTPLTEFMKELVDSPAQQIANVHTIFNLGTTILLLPFGTLLVKLAEMVLPDKKVEEEKLFMYINHDLNMVVGGSAIHLENIRLEIERMYKITIENINNSFNALLNQNIVEELDLVKQEDLVDKLNEGITKEITLCLSHEANSAVSERYSAYLRISNNVERLSDHALNIYEAALEFNKKNIIINDLVKNEVMQMQEICNKMLTIAFENGMLDTSSVLEEQIDDMTEAYRMNMTDRLMKSICTAEGSLIYSNVLVDFERIGDHLLNISEYLNKIK